jgi:vacuolar-type H+-ATPase subunit E/Vma4
MTNFAGVLQHQVQALTDALRQQQELRCQELIAEAEREAAQAVRDSRDQLRERQRQAVREARRQREHELQTARSRVETLRRHRAFAQHEAVLQSLWPLLVNALEERWSDVEQRLAWCNMIVSEAAATLTGPDWIIEHPPDWTSEDRDALLQRMQELGIAAPEFAACDDISNGLRIRTGTACLDGTPDGLLGERRDVEALLLAAWERQDEGHRD